MIAMRAVMGSLMVAGLMAGCASGVRLNEQQAPVETRTPGGETTPPSAADAAGADKVGGSSVTTVDLSQDKDRGNAKEGAAGSTSRIVYFDFDSFVVKDQFRPVVETNAKLLSGDRRKRMVVEGHADERGGREYNLALGQKRAEAVLKSMVLLGATDAQLEAVSFGEEHPAVAASNEEAWAKNRRVELKDR